MAFWTRRERVAGTSLHVGHDDVCMQLEAHVHSFFEGRPSESVTWPYGPSKRNDHFHVLRFAPGADGLWVYVSVGSWAWSPDRLRSLEFIVAADHPTDRAVELIAMASFYNRDIPLGVGHTLPHGRPWLPGSKCDHLLVSLPYPWGPDLETAHVAERHVDFLWLLPITKAERDFKVLHGLEALEQRFEDAELEFWNATRESVI